MIGPVKLIKPISLFVLLGLVILGSNFPINVSALAQTDAMPKGGKTVNRRPVLLTGEVVAIDSQAIIVPPSNSSPTILRNFVADGMPVKTGDLVLRIDGRGDTKLDQLEVEIAQTREKTLRDTADLEVKAIEAEKLLVNAQSALSKARVDAALPKAQIALFDYDKYQVELDRATRDLDVKVKALHTANENIGRRGSDGELALKKLQINYAFAKAEISQAEVRAEQDGFVVHQYGGWTGDRFEEGGNAGPGNVVGQVMGIGRVKVLAWVLESDRPFVTDGQKLSVSFDALPGASLAGTVSSIASAPEERVSWGNGRYFRVEILLPPDHGLPLVHGMSALIEPQGGNHTRQASPSANSAKPGNVRLEGEIQSKLSSVISPPSIRQVWQYNLVFLVGEGTNVKTGQAIATFEANEVLNQLEGNRSSIKEKQRALEKLTLDQAEAARAAELAVNEANSNLEKSERKASLPKELVRRVDYDKLVIERELSGKLVGLTVRQRDAQSRARKAELNGLRSEMAQLQNTIDLLAKGQKELTVPAKRDGMVMHRTDFSGNKFAVGSKVFVGLSVATLADPEKLYVSAKVPEAQANLVKVGQRARVSIPGANLDLAATVSALGRIYHGKSSSQPIVVRDVALEFDALSKGLKPGAAVQVTLLTTPPSIAPVVTPGEPTGKAK